MILSGTFVLNVAPLYHKPPYSTYFSSKYALGVTFNKVRDYIQGRIYMFSDIYLDKPNSDIRLFPGNHIKIGRFTTVIWEVAFGWYSWGHNRPVCGWYLRSTEDGSIKPLQLNDLDDIILIQV